MTPADQAAHEAAVQKVRYHADSIEENKYLDLKDHPAAFRYVASMADAALTLESRLRDLLLVLARPGDYNLDVVIGYVEADLDAIERARKGE